MSSNPGLLKRFIEELFCFDDLLEVGMFTEEMRNDYEAQAERICKYFGLKTIYEYRAEEIRCHVTYVEGHRPEGEPFVTVIPSIYE